MSLALAKVKLVHAGLSILVLAKLVEVEIKP